MFGGFGGVFVVVAGFFICLVGWFGFFLEALM